LTDSHDKIGFFLTMPPVPIEPESASAPAAEENPEQALRKLEESEVGSLGTNVRCAHV